MWAVVRHDADGVPVGVSYTASPPDPVPAGVTVERVRAVAVGTAGFVTLVVEMPDGARRRLEVGRALSGAAAVLAISAVWPSVDLVSYEVLAVGGTIPHIVEIVLW